MTFPVSPVNGQTTTTNNITYVYSSSTNSWKRLASTPGSANSATNLLGGTRGQIPYQFGPGVTSFISTGTTGQFLAAITNSIPTWTNTSSMHVNRAVLSDATLAAVTFNDSNSGDSSSISFNGNTARTVSANTLGALSLSGGGIVSGSVTFSGPVTFSGTATYILSTNTFYTDNIIEMHVPPTGHNTNWNTDDGKDIGFHMHYYTNSTDTNAALLLKNDTKYLEWFSAGDDTNDNIFTATTYGTFKTGSIKLAHTTASNSTLTGALTVEGGAGIGGNLYVGGITSIAGLTTITNTTNATSTNTGALQVRGGIGAGGSIYASLALYAVRTTTAPSLIFMDPTGTFSSKSALYEMGGLLAVDSNNSTKAALRIIKETSNATFATFAFYPLGGAPASGGLAGASVVIRGFQVESTSTSSGSLAVQGGVGISQNLYVGGNTNINGITTVTNTSTSISTTTGALQVVGGVGIGQNLFVGGSITGTSIFVGPWAVSTASNVLTSPFAGIFTITNTTNATSTNTGALQVVGGVGIGGNLHVGGNVIGGGIRTSSTSTAPSNPSVGDIWYNTTEDILYRFTNDGLDNYWLDITSPTFATSFSPAATLNGTETFTNKRINPRVNNNGAVTTGTITPTADLSDQYEILGLTGAITIAAPSGIPVAGQRLMLRIKDNGTSRAITWTTSSGAYRAIGFLLTTSTNASKNLYVGCIYNATDVYWDVVALSSEG